MIKCEGRCSLYASDPEAELRKLWDARGVPKERQDEILADIESKANPEAVMKCLGIKED